MEYVNSYGVGPRESEFVKTINSLVAFFLSSNPYVFRLGYFTNGESTVIRFAWEHRKYPKRTVCS